VHKARMKLRVLLGGAVPRGALEAV
jgi:hypothetical protein